MESLQLEGVPSWLESLFASEFAFVVLLGICILEGAMMLRFMPSELVVPTALALIGASIPKTVAIVAVAVVGTTIGQFLLFRLVRRAGREYVLRKRWFPLTESRLERFDGWFDRWGRGLLTVPAGLSEMDGRTFLVLSAVGSLSFQSILAVLYLLGGYLSAL